mmetsp:Transcript_37409/g.93964  ORF Transcript_37409/g.93964 Transcript_37409/m.93964 type:complete len:234 (-) Transcript_37409:720-1421(-)
MHHHQRIGERPRLNVLGPQWLQCAQVAPGDLHHDALAAAPAATRRLNPGRPVQRGQLARAPGTLHQPGRQPVLEMPQVVGKRVCLKALWELKFGEAVTVEVVLSASLGAVLDEGGTAKAAIVGHQLAGGALDQLRDNLLEGVVQLPSSQSQESPPSAHQPDDQIHHTGQCILEVLAQPIVERQEQRDQVVPAERVRKDVDQLVVLVGLGEGVVGEERGTERVALHSPLVAAHS